MKVPKSKSERDIAAESATTPERAIEVVSTTHDERAILSESTKAWERANCAESANPSERATLAESTTESEQSIADDLVAVFCAVNNRALLRKAVGSKLRAYRKDHGRSEPPDPSIRCQLQRHCAQCKQYQGKRNLFYNPVPGVWQLRPEVYAELCGKLVPA